MAEVSHKPAPPDPPSEEDVRAVAEEFGVSIEAARVLLGSALLDGTELPSGEIVTV